MDSYRVECHLSDAVGYKVLEATTGKEATEATKRANEPIDLILCDLTLPDISGTRLARDLLKSQPDAAVLLVSGTPQTDWNNAEVNDFIALPRERTDFLEKPFQASALQTKISELLRKGSQPAMSA